MKYFVVMMFVCMMGGNTSAQGDVGDWEQRVEGDLSLLELITHCTIIHQLTDVKGKQSAWTALAGGKNEQTIDKPSRIDFVGERAERIWLDLKKSQQSKIYSPGNLTLYLLDNDSRKSFYMNLWNYKSNLHRSIDEDPLKGRELELPQYPELRSDLIQLCKNRYFLKLLEKGELTTDIYTFSPRELQLIIRLCPQSWIKNLHLYAKSESYAEYVYKGNMVKTLYDFLDYDPTKPKEFPLLNEESVKKLALGLDGEVDYTRVFGDYEIAFKKLNENLKNDQYITQRDNIFLYAALRREKIFQPYRHNVVINIKDRIVRKGEVVLLKTYLHQMAQRKSTADLMHLAEIVQSKTFLEGKPEFQNPILDQFALRKEKEVVWILAPLLKHKDPQLAKHSKLIMKKFIFSDLGDDPAKWRDWYREPSEK